MKISYKSKSIWDGDYFQVFINGKKFPRARGVWYKPTAELKKEKKAMAVEMAIGEYSGKYLAKDGSIFNSKKEYEDFIFKKYGVFL